jgi:hypothetical protein
MILDLARLSSRIEPCALIYRGKVTSINLESDSGGIAPPSINGLVPFANHHRPFGPSIKLTRNNRTNNKSRPVRSRPHP